MIWLKAPLTQKMDIQTSDWIRWRLNDSLLSSPNLPRSFLLPPRLCTASTLSMPSSMVLVVRAPAARAAWPRRRTIGAKSDETTNHRGRMTTVIQSSSGTVG